MEAINPSVQINWQAKRRIPNLALDEKRGKAARATSGRR
jgi:hypothetical protein